MSRKIKQDAIGGTMLMTSWYHFRVILVPGGPSERFGKPEGGPEDTQSEKGSKSELEDPPMGNPVVPKFDKNRYGDVPEDNFVDQSVTLVVFVRVLVSQLFFEGVKVSKL